MAWARNWAGKSEDDTVIHRFISTIRNIGQRSDFDFYLSRLNRVGVSGTPTRDEAIKDYRSAMLSELTFGA